GKYVRERIGCRNGAKGVGIIHYRGEKIHRLQQQERIIDTIDTCIRARNIFGEEIRVVVGW
ncbi:MAG: hypothetical protein LC645_02505, partial [Geobacteraceae bacterium]|nr:hypothetical protein [Geobacteraceae bacterium]